MGEPTDSHPAHLTPEAARRVLQALRAEDLPGTSATGPQIDGYVIERELGRGAGGVTFLGHKSGSQARVALKVLHACLGEGRASERAWRELDLLQQIRCPNVPRLLDFGVAGGSLYMATEYVDGVPLNRQFSPRVPSDAEDLRARVRLLENLARAVHRLHERGVIHRDLKPSNVIIGGDGQPFIIDLGIALLVTSDPMRTLTADGAAIGTPAFMAPEQARGEREAISTRSDVYSLGAIGYLLVLGQTPHDLSSAPLAEALRRLAVERPRPAAEISPNIPKQLAAVLSKACAFRTVGRYESAAEFAADLSRWLAREPVLATAPGAWQKLGASIARHPVKTTAAICCAMAIGTAAASAGAVYWLTWRPNSVVLDPVAKQWAAITSRSGRWLYSWRAPQGEGIAFATDVQRPAQFGGGRIALLGMGLEQDGRIVRQLRAFSFREPGALLWATPTRPPEILMPEGTSRWVEDSPPERYRFAAAAVGDMLDTSPGVEVAVILNHTEKSPACLRIYALDGSVLYEAWHNGRINSITWLPSEHLLICSGVTDQPRLDTLDPTFTGGAYRYPVVVFALRPRDAFAPSPEHPGPVPVLLDSWHPQISHDIVWTRTLWPAPAASLLDTPLVTPRASVIALDISAAPGQGDRPPAAHFVINGRGDTESMSIGDSLKARRPKWLGSMRLIDPHDVPPPP